MTSDISLRPDKLWLSQLYLTYLSYWLAYWGLVWNPPFGSLVGSGNRNATISLWLCVVICNEKNYSDLTIVKFEYIYNISTLYILYMYLFFIKYSDSIKIYQLKFITTAVYISQRLCIFIVYITMCTTYWDEIMY